MGIVIENIIGIPALDIEIFPLPSLALCSAFELLVFDPGSMVGWAGVTTYGGTRPRCIEVGQEEWYECFRWRADRVVVERTPFAAQRTFDVWPLYFTGAVLAKLYPQEPEFVLPTDLKVAKRWFELPRKHGLGRHAKDALTHLIGTLVKDAR